MPLKTFAEIRASADQWNDEYVFPSLRICLTKEGWQEEDGLLSSLKTSVLGVYNSCGIKQLCQNGVKDLNLHSLAGVTESR